MTILNKSQILWVSIYEWRRRGTKRVLTGLFLARDASREWKVVVKVYLVSDKVRCIVNRIGYFSSKFRKWLQKKLACHKNIRAKKTISISDSSKGCTLTRTTKMQWIYSRTTCTTIKIRVNQIIFQDYEHINLQQSVSQTSIIPFFLSISDTLSQSFIRWYSGT